MVQWARKVMNDETANLIQSLDPYNLDALEISGQYWASNAWKTYRSVGYPNFDITKDIIYDMTFDVVIAEQVIEHVIYPYRAIRNIYRMIKNGGYFLITLPFLIKIHDIPVDCSRWTPTGLLYFLEECGFSTSNIKINSWGNRECISANLVGFVEYEADIHSLVNEPDFPIVVWALAQKLEPPATTGP